MPSFAGAGGRSTYGSLQPTEIKKTNDAETTALIERRRYYTRMEHVAGVARSNDRSRSHQVDRVERSVTGHEDLVAEHRGAGRPRPAARDRRVVAGGGIDAVERAVAVEDVERTARRDHRAAVPASSELLVAALDVGAIEDAPREDEHAAARRRHPAHVAPATRELVVIAFGHAPSGARYRNFGRVGVTGGGVALLIFSIVTPSASEYDTSLVVIWTVAVRCTV